MFTGKWAMCSVTVGGSPDVYSEIGIYGRIPSILFPINHGILNFVGFTVIEPFVVYGPSRISPEARAAYLASYRERILGLEAVSTIRGPIIADYEGLVLKPELRKQATHQGAPSAARPDEG